MADHHSHSDSPLHDDDVRAASGGIGRFARMALVYWKRTLAAVVTVVALMFGIGYAWTYMVNLAIAAERAKLKDALVALDQGNYEQARSLVRHVLSTGAVPQEEYGTPLFVLGAVKTSDAAAEFLPDERHVAYLVASRYLAKAESYGFPPEREKQGLFLLGKSLVETSQTKPGIEALQTALAVAPTTGGKQNLAIHRLLAEAYLALPKPKYEQSLKELDAVLASDSLTAPQQVAVRLLQAKVLAHLDRYAEAQQALAQVPAGANNDPAVLLARGQLLLDSIDDSLQRLPYRQDRTLPADLQAEVEKAIEVLRQAQAQGSSDPASDAMRRCYYLLGRAQVLLGDDQAALTYFAHVTQQFGETNEGLAAKLAEAEILRQAGDVDAAVIWYRQVLQSDVDPHEYHSDILPLADLRQRILAAVADFLNQGSFAQTLAMLDDFTPIFTSTQELELRGKTLREWGEHDLTQAQDDNKQSYELRRRGLERLREAGVAYENLASLRFATKNYPDDLWNASDCYFLGHSYTNAARVTEQFLQAEPEARNAEALLRLGQVQLAMGRSEECIATLQECIELYERDNATYRARIDCAHAFLNRGDAKESERLLRENLAGSQLEPTSPEWRDSLFALGQLLFEQARYEEAISTLEEAVERYPDDQQALHARYIVGEAYHRWAGEPRSRLASIRTATERERLEQLIAERLTSALEYFKQVQSTITLKVPALQENAPYAAMRRNCYMFEGACLFDLGRYREAIEAYQNVSSLYPNEPFVLETFVQIANCWQRLDRAENAHGAIEQARLTLEQIPPTADFVATTPFSRDEWRLLLNSLNQW